MLCSGLCLESPAGAGATAAAAAAAVVCMRQWSRGSQCCVLACCGAKHDQRLPDGGEVCGCPVDAPQGQVGDQPQPRALQAQGHIGRQAGRHGGVNSLETAGFDPARSHVKEGKADRQAHRQEGARTAALEARPSKRPAGAQRACRAKRAHPPAAAGGREASTGCPGRGPSAGGRWPAGRPGSLGARA